MPERKTIRRARRDRREGKAPTTQAGEFVREEIDRIRAGEHGAASARQAIAIGLSKARRAGVELPAPGKGVSAETRRKAGRDREVGHGAPSKSRGSRRRRSAASTAALKRKPRRAASRAALSRQSHAAAARRGPAARAAAARKASRTKDAARRSRAARKAAATRARRRA
ncbi:hypothetical protein [Solimonas soli]|uniref:hypothetical protein n=1 Tax=Solimonas soli TaxID=413479 RepID=UPI0004888E6C|nr:hypothetical protein [Solimonas soli]